MSPVVCRAIYTNGQPALAAPTDTGLWWAPRLRLGGDRPLRRAVSRQPCSTRRTLPLEMRRVGGVGASVRAVKRDRESEELIASWTLVGDDWRLVEDIKATSSQSEVEHTSPTQAAELTHSGTNWHRNDVFIFS